MRGLLVGLVVTALLVGERAARSEDPDPSVPTAVVSGLGDDLGAVAVSPDGKSVVARISRNNLCVVDVTAGKVVRTLKGLSHPVNSVAFPGGDCDVLISMASGGDRTSKSVLRCWQWSTGGVRQDIDTSSSTTDAERAREVAVSPSTRDFAVSYSTGKLRILDAKKVRSAAELQGDEAIIASCMAFSSDGLQLVTVNGGGRDETIVRIYGHKDEKDPWVRTARFTDAKIMPEDSTQFFWWRKVVFSPDAKLILAHGWFGPDDEHPTSREYDIVRCWDAGTGAPRWTQEVGKGDGSVCDLLMSPRGDGLIVAKGSGIELRDPTTGAVTRTLPKWAKGLNRAAVSPDGRYVFATAFEGSIVKWDLGPGK